MSDIRECLQDRFSDLVDANFIAEVFDRAIIGVETSNLRVMYDSDICIEILMENDDCTYEEAEDDFYYNYVGSFWDGCPGYICSLNSKEEKNG
tara:strand:- start:2325 stop:2603 length:279 start_codon:yes stop_codon:yes gene_type:complete